MIPSVIALFRYLPGKRKSKMLKGKKTQQPTHHQLDGCAPTCLPSGHISSVLALAYLIFGRETVLVGQGTLVIYYRELPDPENKKLMRDY